MRGACALFWAAEKAVARRGPAVSAAGIGGRPAGVVLRYPDGEVINGGRSCRPTRDGLVRRIWPEPAAGRPRRRRAVAAHGRRLWTVWGLDRRPLRRGGQ